MVRRVNTTEERTELTMVDKTAAAMRGAKANVAELRSGLDTLKNALGAIGVTIGVGAMVKLANDTLKGVAALDDMAESTGATVESLSKLERAAKVGGHEFGGLTSAMSRMVQGLKGANGEGQNAGRALDFLGIKAKDVNGNFRDTGEIFIEVARAIGQYRDDGNKLALVQDLLGKGAAQYLPLLKDIAEQGNVAATVTGEQAAAAERLQKQIGALSVEFENAKRDLLNSWVPALIQVTERFNEAQRAASGFWQGLFVQGTSSAATGSIDDMRKRIEEINKELEYFDRNKKATDVASFFTFGMAGTTTGVTVGNDIAERAYLESLVRKRLRANASGLEDDLSGTFRSPAALPRLNYQSQSAAGAGAGGKTASDLLLESSGLDKNFYEDLRKLHAEYASGAITLGTYRDAVQALTEKQQFAQKLAQQQKKDIEDAIASAKAYAEATEAQSAVLTKAFDTLKDYTNEQEFQAQIAGYSAEEQAKLTEYRKIDLQVTQLLTDATGDQVDTIIRWGEEAKAAYDKAAEARQRYADQDARIASSIELERQARAQADKNRDIIAQSISDGIMRGLERGEDLWQVFRSNLEHAVITITIQPVVNSLAQTLAGPLTGALGSVGGSIGLGSLGSFGSFFGGGGGALAANDEIMAAYGAPAASSSLSWLGPAALVAGGLYYTKTSGLGDKLRSNPITGSLLKIADPFNFLGSDDGDAIRKANFYSPLGGKGTEGIQGAQDVYNTEWFGGMTGLDEFEQQLAAREQNLIRNLHLSSTQIDAINARFAGITQKYSFGLEHTDWRQSGAAEAIQADRLNAISEVLGRSIEDLTGIMSLSAEQWQQAIDQLEGAQRQAERSLGEFARALPDTLGITGLEQYRNELSVSDTLSPLDRLSAARSIYEDTLARARGGDLSAVQAFPGAAQELLGIGRDAYASGSGYQDLFREVNLSLNEVLDRQRALQADILRDVPSTIIEQSQNQIAALREQTQQLVDGLNSIKTELQRMQAA